MLTDREEALAATGWECQGVYYRVMAEWAVAELDRRGFDAVTVPLPHGHYAVWRRPLVAASGEQQNTTEVSQ